MILNPIRDLTALAALFTCTSFMSPIQAATIVVHPDGSGDEATIADAVAAAFDGDTILLGPGTFVGVGNRDVDVTQLTLTITAQDGPGTATIDCEQAGRAFTFQNTVTTASELSDLVIENGLISGANGGAILCQGGSPTIRGNIIRLSQSSNGGGIACMSGADPVIEDNDIVDNIAQAGVMRPGGGIFMSGGSSPIIDGNRITDNRAINGGGIYTFGSTTNPQITNNTIEGNDAQAIGGGIRCDQGQPIITGNLIVANTASTAGGMGLVNLGGGTVIEQNSIVANGAGIASGLQVSFSGTIGTTIIAMNTGSAAIDCGAAPPTFDCCLVYGNPSGNATCGTVIDLVEEDPLFCGIGDYTLQTGSPAAAGASPCLERIGALPVSCDPTPLQLSTWGRIKLAHR